MFHVFPSLIATHGRTKLYCGVNKSLL